jgi:hypothetical protein
MNTKLIGIALAGGLLVAGDLLDNGLGGLLSVATFVGTAEARLGRPLTPVSVAGVARRTTRRVVRRSTIYVGALPGGCVAAPINGISYWRCGATYYQASGGRYVVVYVQ